MRRQLAATWKPGEHAAILAPVGGGKTYLAVRGLLPMWPFHLAIDVKGEDPELDTYRGHHAGYPSKPFREGGYRIFPPIGAGPEGKAKTRAALRGVFDGVWKDSRKAGGWTLYIDELRLVADQWGRYFNLTEDIERLWLQGRSRRITVIAATQAPRWVPPAFYEQSKHHFLFRVSDRRALRRLGEIGGDVERIERVVPHLGEHEFLYLSPRGEMTVSRVA